MLPFSVAISSEHSSLAQEHKAMLHNSETEHKEGVQSQAVFSTKKEVRSTGPNEQG